MAITPDTGSRSPDRHDVASRSPDTATSPDTGGAASDRGRRKENRLSPEEIAKRQREAQRQERMRQDAARREAYSRAKVSRAGESERSHLLSVVREERTDASDLFHVTVEDKEGNTLKLQELLNAPEVEIALSDVGRVGTTVGLPTYPDTPTARLEMIRQILIARAEGKNEKDRTDDERKIMSSETARQQMEQTLVRLQQDDETPFDRKKSTFLGSETKFLKTLKPAKEALVREFAGASGYASETVGSSLEALVGMKESEVQNYFNACLRADSLQVTVPWELPEFELRDWGYKNRVTEEQEDATPWTKEGWKKGWQMFWSTREIGQNLALREKLGEGHTGRWGKFAGRGSVNLLKAGILTGAGVGFVGRTLWRSTLEPLAYWGVRGWFKLVGGALEELGAPSKWAKEEVWKKSPWEKRGDPPFVGPLMHLFGSFKRGMTWGEPKPGSEKKKDKKKE